MKVRSVTLLLLAALAGCGKSVSLTGAGATFPYPLYAKWFADYAASTGVHINYQSIGSGGGIQQLINGTVDFGASDAPMTDEEMARAKGGKVLHFPTILGADVVAYNLPGIADTLNLTGELVADIFLGKVNRWNDKRLLELNPGMPLPDREIVVVHRSDGSGTTYVFTDYLSSVSQEWAAGPGRGKEVRWPTGIGAKGNEGVTGQVKQLPGSIGYLELAYARQNKLPVARIRNASGNIIAPTIEAISAAAKGIVERLGPDTDYRVSIVNSPVAEAYPIASFTWLLVYEVQRDPVKGKTLVDFMRWMYTEGQERAAALDYAPLPPDLAQALLARLDRIRIGTQ
ncbi:MAG TPA: phosphate ABC transporter substrate-binding protein PstS [Gemmatimonadaceae bacterium]|nr:phosphate ABC transporter substrate-binding protein PstS [Gemmatimonadaceae bacterium]